ncbi:MAG: ABC transporter permease [Gaiellaceae bacterium]
MLRFVWGQLVNRPSRPAVLALTVLVAAASFVLLTATGQTTEARVQGSVESNYRTAYDILVRPKGSITPIEREQGLVRNNYLSGLFGGITMKQWRQIKAIPGVDVAAPVANIGIVFEYASTVVRLEKFLDDEPVQLFRVRSEDWGPANTRPFAAGTEYIYYDRESTAYRKAPSFGTWAQPADGGEDYEACANLYEQAPKRAPGPYYVGGVGLSCFFERSPGKGADSELDTRNTRNDINPGEIGTKRGTTFPLLLAGIDPTEEARLLGLDRTVAEGRYLKPSEPPSLRKHPPSPYFAGLLSYGRYVPVIASTRSYSDQYVNVRIERLELPAGVDVPRTVASDRAYQFLTGLRGRVVGSQRIDTQAVYDQFLLGNTIARRAEASHYWQSSSVAYDDAAKERLRPLPVENPNSIWYTQATPGSTGTEGGNVPPGNADTDYRAIKGFASSPFFRRYVIPDKPQAQVADFSFLEIVGRYDPAKLRGFSPLSQVPLETYYPPALLPADAASRKALEGKPLGPTENIGDYVAQPPLLLTSLEGMRPLLEPKFYRGASVQSPISVVRVRVAGVAGPDKVSQQRVNAVAAQIRSRTGLEVDITAGSSPRKLLVELPAGKFGRPKLLLEEGWSKKGVSVSFLEALDRKRLALFSLVLVASAFFLANGAFAVVRARRREIGTLLCIGWSQRTIFRAVLGELAVIGLIAGVLGAVLAWQLASSFELELPLWRSAAVVPMAVLLAVSAGLLPAWRAARSLPLDAVRAAVAGDVTGRRVRGLAALARANVRRSPARSLVAAGGLFVGVYALTVLLAVNDAFEGSLVGSVLGEAITLQVRGLDFVSVGLVIALAGLSLADVLYLNLRERAAELATLRTLGWRERHLATVIGLEALWLGATGSLSGAGAGLATGLVLGVPAGPLTLAAGIAAAGGIAVALLASLVPLTRLATLTPSTALADE